MTRTHIRNIYRYRTQQLNYKKENNHSSYAQHMICNLYNYVLTTHLSTNLIKYFGIFISVSFSILLGYKCNQLLPDRYTTGSKSLERNAISIPAYECMSS